MNESHRARRWQGNALAPHTHTKPKSLVRVAGKPILGHLVDRIRSLPMEELILIIDPDESKEASIRQFLDATAPVPVRYVRQTELKGLRTRSFWLVSSSIRTS